MWISGQTFHAEGNAKALRQESTEYVGETIKRLVRLEQKGNAVQITRPLVKTLAFILSLRGRH